MADKHTLARPYARAAFDIAREENRLGPWSDALNIAGTLMASGEAAAFLATPKLTDADRLDFLTGLIRNAGGNNVILDGSDNRGTNFLKLLLEYDRVAVLPEIAERFDELKAEIENTIDVTVTSAVSLSDTQKEQIAAALKERLGREVRLSTETDETLIGGAVVRAGDIVIDGSLRARLQGLANALTA